MSFLGNLFGGGSSQAPAQPAPVSSAPRISDAASETAGMEERARLNRRQGTGSTMLTNGLGDTGSETSVNRTSALGGNSSIT